jgi:hypothetical protein
MDKKIFKWKKLGEVVVDGGIMIVSDAENFEIAGSGSGEKFIRISNGACYG